jgi:hypothetical protein
VGLEECAEPIKRGLETASLASKNEWVMLANLGESQQNHETL